MDFINKQTVYIPINVSEKDMSVVPLCFYIKFVTSLRISSKKIVRIEHEIQ